MTGREKKIYERLKKSCLELPETSEAISWGHPNFRVGKKIFAAIGKGHGHDGLHIAFKALYSREGVFAQRLEATRAKLGDDPLVAEVLAFIDAPSHRGLIRAE